MTQGLLYFIFILPVFSQFQITASLNITILIELIVCTLLLAAGSYVINDIHDAEIDKINKPGKIIVTKSMSSNQAWIYYIIIGAIGFLLAIHIAINTDKSSLLWIYPVSILMLYLYASKLKKSFLIGNVIVSLFSAFVAGLLVLAEWDSLMLLKENEPSIFLSTILLFAFYTVFAFLTSLYREIIKDTQDMEGDKQYNARTAPIIIGVAATKKILYSISLILISILFLWIYHQYEHFPLWKHLILVILVIIPIIYSQVLLSKAKVSNDYKKISSLTKLIMLMGIGYLFLLMGQ